MFSVFVRKKVTINENISFADYVSGIWLRYCSKLTVNWKMATTSQFSDMTSSSIFLTQFHNCFMTKRDWSEIRKWEISQYLETGSSKECKIWHDCLIKCYWMLQNARVTAFTVSEFLRENQRGKITPPSPIHPPG